jgi:hypothetical protein
LQIFFALAALVAVSAAQPTAPVGDSWVYAIQNNDLDFNGKNDDTGEKCKPSMPKTAGEEPRRC